MSYPTSHPIISKRLKIQKGRNEKEKEKEKEKVSYLKYPEIRAL